MIHNVSMVGAGISFVSGASIITGLNLLNLYYQVITKDKTIKPEDIITMSSIAFLGGGMTSFGIYFLVPNFVRSVWTM